MNKFLFKFAAISLLLVGNAAAQVSGLTKVYTVPDGIAYTVDGQFYRTASSAIWPAGTKHVLSLNPEQMALNVKTMYSFGGWQYVGGVLPGGATVMVTAD